MKIRQDYVSNSSSSSFVVENPSCLGSKDSLHLISQAKFVVFADVDVGEDVNSYKEWRRKTESELVGNIEIELYEDSGDEIPEDVCVTLSNGFYEGDNTSKARTDAICDLIRRCRGIYLNFGDSFDCGIKPVQVATLLDYIFGAKIHAEDHFEYDPVSSLGINHKTEQ